MYIVLKVSNKNWIFSLPEIDHEKPISRFDSICTVFFDDVQLFVDSILNEIKNKGYNEAIIVDERLTSTIMALKIGCKLLNAGFEITVGKNRLFTRRNKAVNAIDDFKSYAKLITDKVYENEVVPKIGHCDNDEKEKNPDRIQAFCTWSKDRTSAGIDR